MRLGVKQQIFAFISALMLLLCVQSPALANDWWVDVRNDRVSKLLDAIERGQDPNILNGDGHTALIYAYREGALKSFEALATHPKVDINKQNSYYETAIMYPALADDLARVQLLVKHGAQLNNLGWSPIHYAAIKGNAKIVKYLLDHGAWPNSPAPDGSNPLMMSVSARNVEAVKALLEAGADPRAVNFDGISALDIAKKMNHREILELLSK
ncbi:ankyrin repeat domain-containing protein [Oligella urethralis]|uniref:Ribulose-5-phosphate 4-epimerase and related epimerases and aldolases n=1 Tax=Oligella urethralis TaxID=90245 RepID=A0A2X1UN51_9BURK|nr:ankyrin repeat domain-containing protein [Oligella urethralis]MDK6202041.1 ankyrin repeat domain-containing protein [Oligella urethralis]SPY08529.1 Ribulose-5-phosphate 4-epimerase and related epimerases and aldolases [Oligella urethralis]SUA56068.1 Ribulose-5-phosphate 4-epimerase and related epimerases and aldolases [Oligella urethralis]SUA58645.1 Ribulose-5-phosphate 4-epimerase and related epimerases and aldolases [Oligella urethralis]SUA60880.1 Ribulose-5-phosphate 4-epimerase and rela